VSANETPASRDSDDVRVGDLLGADVRRGEPAVAVVIGFPCDEGVRRNRGRPGAAHAPEAIRAELARLTPGPDPRLDHLIRRTVDVGDVPLSGDLDADQQLLGDTVASWLERNATPIVIGGGHETSYGHFLGHATAGRDVSILNWDAHADVRPLVDGRGHSGSPFRQALEHPSGRCRRYLVAGLQPHRVARAHLDYVRQHGGKTWSRDQLSPATIAGIYRELDAPAIVSFDIDAVDAAEAPGVSAPATNGLRADAWLAAARAAGRHPGTASLDLVEVNPQFDQDHRTVRLAALTIWTFLAGLAER
jgi:formiminoglutamase